MQGFALFGKKIGAKVVDVSAFSVHDFTKKTLLRHIEGGHFKEIVIGVFEHHHMTAGPFGGVYQLPGLIDGEGCRNFGCHMLTLLHGIYGNGGMQIPMRGNVNQIDVVAFTNQLPVLLARVAISLRASHALKGLPGALHTFWNHIDNGYDLSLIDIAEPANGTLTAHAKANNAHANSIDRLGPELQHMGLSGRTLRCGKYLCRLKKLVAILLMSAIAGTQAKENDQQGNKNGIKKLGVHCNLIFKFLVVCFFESDSPKPEQISSIW